VIKMEADCRDYTNKPNPFRPEDGMVSDEQQQKVLGRKKPISLYFLKQKISGAVMIGSGILIPFVMDGDATAALIIVPVGIYLLITKNKVMDF